jgi:putative transcriptional regulator
MARALIATHTHDTAPPLHELGYDLREFFGLESWPPPRALNALQRARMASGLSQAELATELGVCRQTLSAIENRRRIPSVRLALALAIALHRTVEELFPAGELRR